MDKLEQYLDQVCRGIGGPRSLRQHIRRELREHLRDAVAEHQTAGLSDDAALTRALADFGRPEDVRSELEATHGHRLMAVVIDKTLQWKENTMKAKWLWTTAAHLALVAVIAVEVFFITSAMIFIVPRFKMFIREGWFGIDRNEPAVAWIPSFLYGLERIGGSAVWILLAVALAWGFFEWRVRSENKTSMRLSALGTAALGLLGVYVLTTAALVLGLTLGMMDMQTRKPEPIVVNLTTNLDSSLSDLDQALAKKDWEAIQRHVNQASSALQSLNQMGAAAPTLASFQQPARPEAIRAALKSAQSTLVEAKIASGHRDAERLQTALTEFRVIYKPIQEAAKQGQQ